jgi:hypothetical protein
VGLRVLASSKFQHVVLGKAVLESALES